MYSIVKSCLRTLVSSYYRVGRAYRVPFGPVRGLRLVYDPLVQYRFMLGVYDSDYVNTAAAALGVCNRLTTGFTAIDAGANIGYFTLWMAKLAETAGGGSIYSFEALSRNARIVENNANANRFVNSKVIVENCAIADHVGTIKFFEGSCNLNGSLLQNWAQGDKPADHSNGHTTEVSCTTLDVYAANFMRLDFLKIDIEGAGVFALAHMKQSFALHRPLAIMESHTADEDLTIGKFLQSLNYSAFRLNNRKWVKNLDECHKNPEGVWGTMLFIPNESAADVRRIL